MMISGINRDVFNVATSEFVSPRGASMARVLIDMKQWGFQPSKRRERIGPPERERKMFSVKFIMGELQSDLS